MDIGTAVLAAAAALAVAYLTNFEKERYVRHLDAAALAGALSGEMRSHRSAFPHLLKVFSGLEQQLSSGLIPPIRATPQPSSPVFDSGVGKLGLLGPDLAEEVAYLYEQLRTFRAAIHVLTRDHAEMELREVGIRCTYLRGLIEQNTLKADSTISALAAFAHKPYVSSLQVAWRTICRRLCPRGPI